MDIKEIALKVARKVDPDFQGLPSDRAAFEFAEALIESYKAELLKEVGEPVGSVSLVNCTDIWLNGQLYKANPKQYLGAAYFKPVNHGDKLFTSDQVAAAVAKATKQLEEEVERLKKHQCAPVCISHEGDEREELKKQLAAAQEEWNQCSGLLDDAHRSIEILEDQLAKAEQRVAEWQPIETAPKDGTGFLAAETTKRPFVALWLDADHPDVDEAGWYDHWNFDPVSPTHWMPLPKAPNGASS